MRNLLNTLYVSQPNTYLSLQGENVVIKQEGSTLGRFPLHNLEQIVSFSDLGVSPKLAERCSDKNISICFLSPGGRFRARVTGHVKGSVHVRKSQFLHANDLSKSLALSKNFIFGKIYNEFWVINRYKRDYPLRIDVNAFNKTELRMRALLSKVTKCESFDELRGLEGNAQSEYYSRFDNLILNQRTVFSFSTRTRRPPKDPANCLLSFGYSLLANDVASALETVGLDPSIGFIHVDRSGRNSLALDLMEELRAPLVDRFILSLINNQQVKSTDFIFEENGSVILKDDSRRSFLESWQKRKTQSLTHPFLKEKIEWGLVSHCQAMLLSKYLREELDCYPPFCWK